MHVTVLHALYVQTADVCLSRREGEEEEGGEEEGQEAEAEGRRGREGQGQRRGGGEGGAEEDSGRCALRGLCWFCGAEGAAGEAVVVQ